jgi:hypothetical protein
LQPTEKKTIKSTPAEHGWNTKNKKSITARPKNCRRKPHQLESVKGTGPDGAITRRCRSRNCKKRKIEPENQCSSSSDSVSNSCDEQVQQGDPALLFGKKIDLTKALAWLQETNNQRSVKKDCSPLSFL